MTRTRKPPRWVVPFLRALERTGEVRQAAEDAGVDFTTAYARRRTHAEFAEAWVEALKAHGATEVRGEEDELARVPHTPHPPIPAFAGTGPSLSHEGRGAEGAELVVSGDRLKRASLERWGPRKEEAFLAELAATGNLKLACKAAGISYEAVRKRRLRDPQLDRACKAAVAACAARIPEYLAGAAAATFDPDAFPDDETNPLPRVTIEQAIKISQLNGSRAQRPGFEELPPSEEEIEQIRERLFNKLQRLRQREMPQRLAEGWTHDESHDVMVPPGYVRNPRWRRRKA